MTTNVRTQGLSGILPRFRLQRGAAFGIIIITALFSFELFNYSTTEFALGDLLGELRFAGIRWATILAIAFCGIDFAGIARLFTPEEGANEPNEVWYLFGAWLMAATMNAMLTWWGVSLAIVGHETLGNAVVGRETLLRVVPIFVAVMVWLIRVLIIGTFSVAGNRLFSQAEKRPAVETRTYNRPEPAAAAIRSLNGRMATPGRVAQPAAPIYQGAAKTYNSSESSQGGRPEPSYHPVAMSAAEPDGKSGGSSYSRERLQGRRL